MRQRLTCSDFKTVPGGKHADWNVWSSPPQSARGAAQVGVFQAFSGLGGDISHDCITRHIGVRERVILELLM